MSKRIRPKEQTDRYNRERADRGYLKEYYRKNTKKFKDQHLRLRFGITLEQYLELCASQGNVCAICGKHDTLQIDHDHKTGRIRKLLCGKCNRGLGMFEENPEIISRALEYLRGWDNI